MSWVRPWIAPNRPDARITHDGPSFLQSFFGWEAVWRGERGVWRGERGAETFGGSRKRFRPPAPPTPTPTCPTPGNRPSVSCSRAEAQRRRDPEPFHRSSSCREAVPCLFSPPFLCASAPLREPIPDAPERPRTSPSPPPQRRMTSRGPLFSRAETERRGGRDPD
jgi:hypothetical protein